ncbi:rRNA maturation RNase YbeY [Bacillus chungangensis]|uniref:Endoribonuclease YbeY n=1 Tax=Bacillus chungangensis TaxID=587633 RepID=A0ABT9WLS6_9BACI|nr:rRNA maturation RNase YbeY [Bacillus chungangensis]MDQ0174179.1 putative rRNA maturation factor [Bacillus chungangensis]
MPLVIDFHDETNQLSETDFQPLEALLQTAAEYEKLEHDAEISVTFVTNATIQALNRDYRQYDRVTDVLSFAMEELGEGEIEILGIEEPRMLGDIVISLPKAEEQAIEYGHSLQRELGFLALHGFLHLLGYDHMTEEEEAIMFTKQKEILSIYGLER